MEDDPGANGLSVGGESDERELDTRLGGVIPKECGRIVQPIGHKIEVSVAVQISAGKSLMNAGTLVPHSSVAS